MWMLRCLCLGVLRLCRAYNENENENENDDENDDDDDDDDGLHGRGRHIRDRGGSRCTLLLSLRIYNTLKDFIAH